MNRTSARVYLMIWKYCNAENIAKLTGDCYFKNLIENFGEDFGHYLCRHYQVLILSYRNVMNRLYRKDEYPQYDKDLCVYHVNTCHYRFLERRDLGVIKAIIRKYYQDSDEINLRIALLFNSKLGTRYLSRITGLSKKLISEVRHGHVPIKALGAEERLNLENVYLNSELAFHIRRLRVHFG